jgi:hypothetical protein
MSQPADKQTTYGHDQDRDPPPTARTAWQDAEDLNPDDYGPDAEDGTEVNPATGAEYGEVGNTPAPGTRAHPAG